MARCLFKELDDAFDRVHQLEFRVENGFVAFTNFLIVGRFFLLSAVWSSYSFRIV
jgi:hypothetical protein